MGQTVHLYAQSYDFIKQGLSLTIVEKQRTLVPTCFNGHEGKGGMSDSQTRFYEILINCVH